MYVDASNYFNILPFRWAHAYNICTFYRWSLESYDKKHKVLCPALYPCGGKKFLPNTSIYHTCMYASISGLFANESLRSFTLFNCNILMVNG